MRAGLLAVLLVVLPSTVLAAEPAALAKARALYNAGSFDAAIAAATPVRQQPQWVDAATLVIARSHLERFRSANDAADLAAGRALLATVRAALLTPRDQLDLLIGLGQSLYLGGRYGPSAEIFDSALGQPAAVSPRERQLLLDWWATALDREAQGRPPDRRAPVFARIVARMEDELRETPGSRAANYWLAAALRGTGDLDRAWAAAVAGWVRAGLSGDGAVLRSDLDRLVMTALATERARQRAPREQAEAALREEWQALKEAWP